MAIDPNALLFSIADDAPQGAPLLTLPGASGIGLYRRRVSAELRLTFGGGIVGSVTLKGCFVQLGGNGDGLIDLLLAGPAQPSHDFDVALIWDSQTGVSIGGGAGLEFTIPIRAKLPAVKLEALHIGITPQVGGNPRIEIELSANASATLLGVVGVSVERLGVIADLVVSGAPPANAVAIGPFTASLRFKSPTGAGLTLKIAGIIDGGGFLSIDTARGQYAGVLTLNLFGIGVTAIGIVSTKPRFSLIAVITANFRPVGIDIGLGFTINAIGGIVGLHRGIDFEKLSEGVRTNAIASLMFPANPVANAPRIIEDIARFFPAVEDQFVVGPLIEMGWGKPTGMITLALGVAVQVPDARLAVMGILRVIVPPGTELAPLRIQVNVLGRVEFARRFIAVDGSLFDSRIAFYTLDGDMAARLRWGAGANFAVTVGGFHPRFTPAADLELPPMRRVSINLLPTKNNPRLRLDSYYAATSNTLQHGASIDAYAAIAGFGVRGHLGYDVLAQLAPLRIDAGFSGEVAVIAAGEEIMSTRLDLQLQGPNPWHVRGEASFKVLIKRIRIPVEETFGNPDAPSLPTVKPADAFFDQVSRPRNWIAAVPGQDRVLVTLRPTLSAPPEVVLAHPAATIEFNQQAMPLNVVVQRFGAAKVEAPTKIEVTSLATALDPLKLADPAPAGEFAPAQFFEMTLDEKAAAPAFARHRSGARADPASLARFTKETPRVYGYEPKLLDSASSDLVATITRLRQFDVTAAHALGAVSGSAVARSALHGDRVSALATGREITATEPGYRVVEAATMKPSDAFEAHTSHAAARQALDAAVDVDPALAGRLMILAEHELV